LDAEPDFRDIKLLIFVRRGGNFRMLDDVEILNVADYDKTGLSFFAEFQGVDGAGVPVFNDDVPVRLLELIGQLPGERGPDVPLAA